MRGGNRRAFGGVEGNSRLTALAGLVLLALLLVELATVPGLRSHVTVHMFVGLLLLPLALLKLASTGYRFSGYYLRRQQYRAQGPPALLPRLLVAPFLVLSTLTLLGSGLMLTFESPSRGGGALALHKASFAVWLLLIAAHVLLNWKKLFSLLQGDWPRRRLARAAAMTSGRGARLLLLAAALVLGLALALLTLSYDHRWAHYLSQFRFGDG